MVQDMTYKKPIQAVSYVGYKPVFISADIEYRKISDFIRTRKKIFHILKSPEFSFFYDRVPPVHALPCFRILFAKFLNFLSTDNMHLAPALNYSQFENKLNLFVVGVKMIFSQKSGLPGYKLSEGV